MKKLLLFTFMLTTGFFVGEAQTVVTFYTTQGNFEVEIYDEKKPITGGNFLKLVDEKFYDGVIFHRVIDGFMIQGGDPTGTGSGGPGYKIQDEFDSSLSNIQKTISMANSGPNTGGSQFFINLVNNTYLDFDKSPYTSKHPVFGMVIKNFSVVQAIGKVPTNSKNRPLTDVVMDSIRVTSNTSGLKARAEKMGLTVFPNPVTENSFVRINIPEPAQASLTVTDMTGRIAANEDIYLQKGSNDIPVRDLLNGNIGAGLYLLKIRTSQNFREIVIVKQ